MGSFRVMDVFSITGKGVVPVGQVVSGTIEVGQSLTVNGRRYPLKQIEMHHQQLRSAGPGQAVGLLFDGLLDKSLIQRNQVLQIE